MESVRNYISGKPIGRNSTIIEVQSTNPGVTFSLNIHVEHGGTKVVMEGNIGGEFLQHKLLGSQSISNDLVALATAKMFAFADGKEDDGITIKYTRLK